VVIAANPSTGCLWTVAGDSKFKVDTLSQRLDLSDPTVPSGPVTPPAAGKIDTDAFQPLKAEALPPSFDWRTQRIVTPLRDQGACGSCWTFGTGGHAHYLDLWGQVRREREVPALHAHYRYSAEGGQVQLDHTIDPVDGDHPQNQDCQHDQFVVQ